MGLQSEPVDLGKYTSKPEITRRNGANGAEIEFLYGRHGGKPQGVELNMMTSRQIIEFLERKFAEHGVTKVVPDKAIIEQHARRLIEAQLTKELLSPEMLAEVARKAAAARLPRDLDGKIRKLLTERPALSWDLANKEIFRAG
jgi:hypothetical protein